MNLNNLVVSSQVARNVVEAGRDHNYRFTVVGSGEVPQEPYFKDGWWTEPLVDESTIPYIVQERLKVAKSADNLQGCFIMHDAPKLLMAPKEEPKEQVDLMPVITTIVFILGVVVLVLGWIFLALLRVDPILVCVLSDGTYVEVARWSDSTSR